MNLKEALRQNPKFPCPQEILGRQVLVPVRFYDFDGVLGEGEIVVDHNLEKDVAELFLVIIEERFPIASVIPIADMRFAWDDGRSMRANNTSGFNYRQMTGTSKISNHSLGRAIDINPLLNPYIKRGVVLPAGATYDVARPGTIVADSFIVRFLKERGWAWGGDWTSLKDHQHFEKVRTL